MANNLKDKLRTFLVSKSKVSTLVGQRVFFQHLPIPRTLPAILLHIIDDEDQLSHGGASNQLARAIVQVDCFGDTDASSNNVADAVRDVVQFYAGTMGGLDVRHTFLTAQRDISERPIDGSDQYIYGRSVDLTIWFRPTVPTT